MLRHDESHSTTIPCIHPPTVKVSDIRAVDARSSLQLRDAAFAVWNGGPLVANASVSLLSAMRVRAVTRRRHHASVVLEVVQPDPRRVGSLLTRTGLSLVDASFVVSHQVALISQATLGVSVFNAVAASCWNGGSGGNGGRGKGKRNEGWLLQYDTTFLHSFFYCFISFNS